MGYHIFHLDNVTLKKQLYFFDANMWIKLLRPRLKLKPREQKYIDFFQKFFSSPANPRIAVTSMVLAEVINRIMREVAMAKYIKENNVPEVQVTKGYYKEVYRKTNHFKIQYELLCDDIKAYHTKFELLEDSFGKGIKAKHVLSRPSYTLDFNDSYYVLLAKNHKIPIITDDGDFFVDDVEILTYNDALYQRGKDSVQAQSQKTQGA